MDTTFKTCPRPFYQFATIHGLYLDRVVPLIMILMSGKTEAMYRSVLRHVKRRIEDLTDERYVRACVCIMRPGSLNNLWITYIFLFLITNLSDRASVRPFFPHSCTRWSPNKVLMDFEMAMMNAFREELPGIRIIGCYFHLCQSLWRKVQDIGLAGQ